MNRSGPLAIVDIGSNSVRLVVYAGASSPPTPIFNEKVVAGLGAGKSRTLPKDARSKALAALSRFRVLIDDMNVRQTAVVATAAIRDAEDGSAFIDEVVRIGFDVQLLSGEEEARLAGEGVSWGMADAAGIVGDLGGGSLELVEVGAGADERGLSMPLGVLRIDHSSRGEREAREILKAGIDQSALRERGRGRAFYTVGGSWRALARIDMIANGLPITDTHGYRMSPDRPRRIRSLVDAKDPRLSAVVKPERLATSPVAAMLLELIVDELEPSQIVVSAFGIREGLLRRLARD